MFAGQQLTVLADDVLVSQDAFTDYTDTDGQWNTVDSDGDLIDKTVWTRYIHIIIDGLGLSKIPTQVIILHDIIRQCGVDSTANRGLLSCVLHSCPVRHLFSCIDVEPKATLPTI